MLNMRISIDDLFLFSINEQLMWTIANSRVVFSFSKHFFSFFSFLHSFLLRFFNKISPRLPNKHIVLSVKKREEREREKKRQRRKENEKFKMLVLIDKFEWLSFFLYGDSIRFSTLEVRVSHAHWFLFYQLSSRSPQSSWNRIRPRTKIYGFVIPTEIERVEKLFSFHFFTFQIEK